MTEEAEVEYKILFPKEYVNFRNDELTFIINHMKSRLPSTVYVRLHLFDETDTDITLQSPRWVIDNTYSRYTYTFKLNDDIIKHTSTYQIELRLVNITSENPLYFTEIMLTEETFDGYHTPHEIIENKRIGFNKSRYTNLYDSEENFLQVIRPNGDEMGTGELTKSKCTVLAPHLDGEPSTDTPVNIFLEFMNQKEQRIDVLR